MPARRLAWIGGAAAALAAILAVLALWRDAAPQAPGESRAGSRAAPGEPRAPAGSAARAGSDASAAAHAGSAGDPAALVASARAELAAGRLVQARALLERAYALDPAPATLLELAGVERQTGHCREARRATQRVVNEASGDLADRARQLLVAIGRCD